MPESQKKPARPLGFFARVVLGLGGLLLLWALFSDESPGAGRALLIPGLFLWGALLGSDPLTTVTGRTSGSYWVLPRKQTPEVAPVSSTLAGAALGAIYAAVYESWLFVLLGAAAGLFVGVTAPLFRFRIGAAVIVFLTAVGISFGVGFDTQVGTLNAFFISWCVAFVYAALLWGDRTFGGFWSSR